MLRHVARKSYPTNAALYSPQSERLSPRVYSSSLLCNNRPPRRLLRPRVPVVQTAGSCLGPCEKGRLCGPFMRPFYAALLCGTERVSREVSLSPSSRDRNQKYKKEMRKQKSRVYKREFCVSGSHSACTLLFRERGGWRSAGCHFVRGRCHRRQEPDDVVGPQRRRKTSSLAYGDERARQGEEKST